MITIATLPQYTAQQVFDYIANHLLSQGEKCQDFDHDSRPICVYKNSDNQSCAAGCLFGVGEYKKEYEGRSWGKLVVDNSFPSYHYSLIVRLQELHDRTCANNWYKALLDVAKEHDFDTTNLHQYAKENNFC